MLSRQALNRATLARQLLLERARLSPEEAIEHLGGLQAQTPHTWYVGLWTRLVDFRPEVVSELLQARRLVRIALMRSTIHLVTARDCLAWRPLFQPVLERSMNGNFGKHLVGLDREELAGAGRAVLEERPRTFSELGRVLAERWPDRDEASLAQAIRAWEALVQVPPRGLWGRSGRSLHTTAQSWLGRPLAADPSPEDLALRYLGAFGPATVRDAQTWSGLTRLAEVMERLRPRLVTLNDEDGRELFDLPDAPRPDPETPVPVRFLYDYDNLLLSHADRSRVVTDDYRRQDFQADGPMPRIVLVDGFTYGCWTIEGGRGQATLTITPFRRLTKAESSALAAEGEALLRFASGAAARHEVRILAPR